MKPVRNKYFLPAASAAAAALLLAMGSVAGGAALLWPLLAFIALIPISERGTLIEGLAAYAAAAAFAMLVLPEKTGATLFLIMGHYPILRPRIAGLHAKSLRAAIRFCIAVSGSCIVYALIMWLYSPLPEELAVIGPGALLSVLIIGGGIYFMLYDFILSRCSFYYRERRRSVTGGKD